MMSVRLFPTLASDIHGFEFTDPPIRASTTAFSRGAKIWSAGSTPSGSSTAPSYATDFNKALSVLNASSSLRPLLVRKAIEFLSLGFGI